MQLTRGPIPSWPVLDESRLGRKWSIRSSAVLLAASLVFRRWRDPSQRALWADLQPGRAAAAWSSSPARGRYVTRRLWIHFAGGESRTSIRKALDTCDGLQSLTVSCEHVGMELSWGFLGSRSLAGLTQLDIAMPECFVTPSFGAPALSFHLPRKTLSPSSVFASWTSTPKSFPLPFRLVASTLRHLILLPSTGDDVKGLALDVTGCTSLEHLEIGSVQYGPGVWLPSLAIPNALPLPPTLRVLTLGLHYGIDGYIALSRLLTVPSLASLTVVNHPSIFRCTEDQDHEAFLSECERRGVGVTFRRVGSL